MDFAKALTCAQEGEGYFSWKMENLCDECYNHLLPGHLANELEEINATVPSPAGESTANTGFKSARAS